MHKFLISGLAISLVLALSAGDLLASEGGGGGRPSVSVEHAAFLTSAIRGGIDAAETAHVTGDQATIDLLTTDDATRDLWMAMLVLIYGDNQRPQARELQGQTFGESPGAARGASSGSNGLTAGLRLHADPAGSGSAGVDAASSSRGLSNACESSAIRLPGSASGQTRDFCSRGPAFPLGS